MLIRDTELDLCYLSGVSYELEDCVIRCEEPLLVCSSKLTMTNCAIDLNIKDEYATCLEFNSSEVSMTNCSISITYTAREVVLFKSVDSTANLSSSSICMSSEEFSGLVFSEGINSNVKLASLRLFTTPVSILFNKSIQSQLEANKIAVKSRGFIPFQEGDNSNLCKITINGDNVLSTTIAGTYRDYFNKIAHDITTRKVVVDTREAPVILNLPSLAEKEVTICNPYKGTVIIGDKRKKKEKIKLVFEDGEWKF